MAPIEVTTRELDAGFPILVREAGVGAGPPVLCVAGGPGMGSGYFFPDPAAWGPGLRALAGDHHLIAYDPRGCGGSGVPDEPEPLALSRHVEDVERVRKALGLGPVAVFGHSFGTVLAIFHALQHPESTTRLLLSGGAPTRDFQEGYRRALGELPEEDRRRLAEIEAAPLTDETLLERFSLALPLYFHRTPDAAEREALLDSVAFSARVNRALAAGLEGYDLRPALPHVTVPTLVVYGESDRVVQPRYQLRFQGALPAARFVAFSESGHFPFLEEPEPFARVAHYFIRHADHAGTQPGGNP